MRFGILLLFLVSMLIIGFRPGESSDYSEWIIEIKRGALIEDLMIKMEKQLGGHVENLGLVSKHANLYLIRISGNQVQSRSHESVLYSFDEIISVTKNAEVNMRLRPDDTEYDARQQNMEIIEAPLAWDITTGGVTPNGDTIVVAVIDEGFQLTHTDLIDNLWTFRGEIADDGIDNDGNGYIDDINGWDASNEQGITSRQVLHGTGVAGIVGAQGNNAIGVTGVNWDTKLLLVDIDAPTTVATILKAYDYVLSQRILYNTTNGELGAYIVATNSSFGSDNSRPSDFPAWCEFYDRFGAAGILNAAATTNDNVDVELEGDLPTLCTSQYLITATSTNLSDFASSTGFGITSVDLGAPGSGTFTTTNNNSYGVLGGTSSSSPHIAGLIGLIYSIPCEELGDLMRDDVQGYMTLVRDNILSGVDTLPDLKDRTLTGGRVNVNTTVTNLLSICAPPPSESNVYNIVSAYPVPTDGNLIVEYESPDSEEECISIFNAVGQHVRTYPSERITLLGKRFSIDNLDLSPGVYFLRLPCDDPQADHMIVVQ